MQQGPRARENRRRILAAATAELARDPDASMDGIARATGVVRRTLYGHFPTREALVEGIADQALTEMAETFDRAAAVPGGPAETLARFVAALWHVGDRYRLLIRLGERTLPGDGIRDRLTPVRDRVAGLLRAGQATGDFTGHLPAPVLAQAVEGLILALLQSVNDALWTPADPAAEAARASLVAAGVPEPRATALTATRTPGDG